MIYIIIILCSRKPYNFQTRKKSQSSKEHFFIPKLSCLKSDSIIHLHWSLRVSPFPIWEMSFTFSESQNFLDTQSYEKSKKSHILNLPNYLSKITCISLDFICDKKLFIPRTQKSFLSFKISKFLFVINPIFGIFSLLNTDWIRVRNSYNIKNIKQP